MSGFKQLLTGADAVYGLCGRSTIVFIDNERLNLERVSLITYYYAVLYVCVLKIVMS